MALPAPATTSTTSTTSSASAPTSSSASTSSSALTSSASTTLHRVLRGLGRFAVFQACWWGCALAAAHHAFVVAALAPLLFVALAVGLARRRAAVFVGLAGAAVGVVVDAVLVAVRAVDFGGGVPLYIATVSAAFALALPLPRGLGRGVAGAFIGAVFGVASYAAAADVGAFVFDRDQMPVVALVWAFSLPAFDVLGGIKDNVHADRRVITVPRTFGLWLLAVATAPVWLVVGFVVDVARGALAQKRPFITLRLGLFGVAFLSVSCLGLLRMMGAGLLVADPARLQALTYEHQARFTAGLFSAVCRAFRLRFVVDGDDCLDRAGPLVVLVRHASIIDTLVPSVFITQRHGRKLRFVLKRELLADPCLDIAGHRIPNHFVARNGEDTGGARAGIAALGKDIGDDGILLYPEGTRFTPAKQAQALARVPETLRTAAAALTHTLPPKVNGADAALDAVPAADVVFVAHVGLEGFSHVRDIWSGALFGRTVHVRLWRVARADVPVDKNARAAWLYGEWAQVNAFVSSTSRTSTSAEAP